MGLPFTGYCWKSTVIEHTKCMNVIVSVALHEQEKDFCEVMIPMQKDLFLIAYNSAHSPPNNKMVNSQVKAWNATGTEPSLVT